jgi:hypothetical protein
VEFLLTWFKRTVEDACPYKYEGIDYTAEAVDEENTA